jgi:acetamidase/formamidase
MVTSAVTPQTGPFYIEGAEPGDILVVTIDKLEANRATGTSRWVITPNAIDPASLARNREERRVTWDIDKNQGIVRLDLAAAIPGTDWAARFQPPAFELPLRPMLASLGVAPSTAEGSESTIAGAFGGQLNYAGITAGVRVMLSVAQPGALLVLGLGQARQGDGSIAGSGIDTSLNVEFSVEIVKKKEWPHSTVMRPLTVAGEFPIEAPRLESDTELKTIGTGASLLQALQRATLELHHWLDDDFGLSERSVSILLSQTIEYDIADVSGPFTIVAKIAKAHLLRPAPAP